MNYQEETVMGWTPNWSLIRELEEIRKKAQAEREAEEKRLAAEKLKKEAA